MTEPPIRGDVILVDLGQPIGHEAGLTRPAIVVSHDRLAYVGLVTVLPVTRTRLGYPSHLEVEPADSGLHVTSHVQSEQVRTISVQRTVRVIGHLRLTTTNAISGLLRTNLALN